MNSSYHSTRSGHAIVIGRSIAGMCAARVLSDVFEQVTVLDRDTFPEQIIERKGVPQSHHPHALLHGGRQQLERLFPGFVENMLSGGALELDPGEIWRPCAQTVGQPGGPRRIPCCFPVAC